jgi:uncharacterized membrane protein
MGRAKANIVVPALASEAEQLWYDTSRWPTFIDGLHHVARLEGDWPHAGSRVVWDSKPGGRGRVQERATSYVAREEGVNVVLELRYTLKEDRPGMAIVDLFFIRRQQRESLQRTLRRFRTEVAAERESSL